jgi:adenosine deaminase
MIERLVEIRRQGGARRVIGMGMDSTELGTDPRQFIAAYRLGGQAGLRRTGHQGESTAPDLILVDLDELGMERVDHGITSLQSPEVVARLVGEGIPLTVCPISNIKIANAVTRLEDHPWPQMQAAGLHVTLNTDDPAMIDDDLGTEYAAVAKAFGSTFGDMVEVSLAGVDATWLADDEKRAMRARVKEAAEGLAGSIQEP